LILATSPLLCLRESSTQPSHKRPSMSGPPYIGCTYDEAAVVHPIFCVPYRPWKAARHRSRSIINGPEIMCIFARDPKCVVRWICPTYPMLFLSSSKRSHRNLSYVFQTIVLQSAILSYFYDIPVSALFSFLSAFQTGPKIGPAKAQPTKQLTYGPRLIFYFSVCLCGQFEFSNRVQQSRACFLCYLSSLPMTVWDSICSFNFHFPTWGSHQLSQLASLLKNSHLLVVLPTSTRNRV
jgi:hypothetical protein